MWYFLAGAEVHYVKMVESPCRFALATFLKMNQALLGRILEKVDNLLIDSGAYSLQRGKGGSVDFEAYLHRYIEFIRANDSNPKIVGFFEMDIDNVVGYNTVLRWRRELEKYTSKLIPVWHSNRGVAEFIEMCKQYSGRRVAITALGEDIALSQYNSFINTAHKHGCKIHILGMTSWRTISQLNLGKEDSVDSTSWIMQASYGDVSVFANGRVYNFNECVSQLQGISTTGYGIINYLAHRRLQMFWENIDQSVNV